MKNILETGPSLRPYFLRSVSSNGGSTDAGSSSLNQSQALSPSKWKRLWKPFLLMQLTLGLGFLAIAFKQFRRKNTHPSQSPELIAKDWEVRHSWLQLFRILVHLDMETRQLTLVRLWIILLSN